MPWDCASNEPIFSKRRSVMIKKLHFEAFGAFIYGGLKKISRYDWKRLKIVLPMRLLSSKGDMFSKSYCTLKLVGLRPSMLQSAITFTYEGLKIIWSALRLRFQWAYSDHKMICNEKVIALWSLLGLGPACFKVQLFSLILYPQKHKHTL